MKRQDAYDIIEGRKRIDDLETPPSTGEMLQLMMGACLEGDDIWCCICDRPNECCECGMEDI